MAYLYNIADVLALEQSIIEQLPVEMILPEYYFKEEVGLILYYKWVEDHQDTRILTYCFPVIHNQIIKNYSYLLKSNLEYAEIFNILCIKLLEAFKFYNIKQGRLFSFLINRLGFKIRDIVAHSQCKELPLEEGFDIPVEDYSVHMLEDFKTFLLNLQENQGPTHNRFLKAFLETLNDPNLNIAQNQTFIKEQIVERSKLPIEFVEPYYQSVLDRYRHSVLD